MQGANKVAIWVITGLMAVLTMFFNLFIFLMSLKSYKQNKHWTPCETIITALSLANGAHQLLCYLWMTMIEIDKDCRLEELFYSLMILTVFSLKFTIMWTTSFLTFYYSTKLVIEPIHCYTKIQEAILKHVTTVVLVIPMCGLSTCLPMLTVLVPENNTSENMDCGSIMPDDTPGMIYNTVYLVLSNILPGILMVKCCISISVHLGIHLQHMKASTNGSHAPKLGSEMRVIRMTLALVVVFLCFMVVDLYAYYQVTVKKENAILLSFLFTSIYTTFSALVLIYGKKTFWKVLLHSYNVCLDEFPCRSWLKVPETKRKTSSAHTVKH